MPTIIFKDKDTKEEIHTLDVDMFVVAVSNEGPRIDVFVAAGDPLFAAATVSETVAEVAPTAPSEPEYRPTATIGDFTIEQYMVAGWSIEQLVDRGMAELVAPAVDVETAAPVAATEPVAEVAPVEPVAEVAPIAPVTLAELVADGPVMTAKAQGADYQQFIDSGWTHEQLVEHGYVEPEKVVAEPVAPVVPEVPVVPVTAVSPPQTDGAEWPKLDGSNWIDSSGAVWDETLHSRSKDSDVPPVVLSGVFKKRRGAISKSAPVAPSAAPEAPETPAAETPAAETPAVPAVPAAEPAAEAPEAPSVPAAEPALVPDPELADLIKSWG